eukprot:2380674-Heterocapsa_arctica.AAC.1
MLLDSLNHDVVMLEDLHHDVILIHNPVNLFCLKASITTLLSHICSRKHDDVCLTASITTCDRPSVEVEGGVVRTTSLFRIDEQGQPGRTT